MNTGEITIIVPTYNRLDYFKTAISSILNQQLLPLTLIIGDDSQDEHTENWVKQEQHNWPFETRYYHNSPGLGQADNVEDLIQKVNTPYMILLHDDDALEPNALRDLYAEMGKGRADVVFGKQYIIDKDDRVDHSQSEILNRNYLRTEAYANKGLDPLAVALNQQLPSNSFLMKSALAQEIHYHFKEQAGDAVDFYFCLQLALRGVRFQFINTYVSRYRITPVSVSSGGNMAYYAYNLVKIVEVDEQHKKLKDNFLTTYATMAIPIALRMGKREEAKAMCFSKYHRNTLLTPGGLKRLGMVMGFIKI